VISGCRRGNTAIWGTTFPLLRTTLHFVNPFDIIALRFTIAGAVLALVYRKRLFRI